MKMEESSLKGLKILWEKEKLLIMCDFSLSHSIFKQEGQDGPGSLTWIF